MFDDGVLIVALLFVFVFLLGFLAGALYLNGEYASGSYVYFNAATPITIRGASNKMIYVVWGGAAATAVLGFFCGALPLAGFVSTDGAYRKIKQRR